MASQAISEFPALSAGQVADNDLLPIVDVSDLASPGGTTKKMLVSSLGYALNPSNGVFNVLDYGAVGGGSVDDTAAIQAAIVAGTGQTVVFPKNRYKISATLAIPDNTQVIGEMWGSILEPTAALNNSVAVQVGSGVILDGLFLAGSNTTGCIGLDVNAPGPANVVQCRNMEISGFTGTNARGMRLAYCVTARFDNLYVFANEYNLHVASVINTPTDVLFVNCQFRTAIHKGAWIQTGYNILFLKCLFESNAEEGTYLYNTTNCTINNIVYQSCWFENNWTSLSGAPRLAQYEAWVRGSIGGLNVLITATFRDCQFDTTLVQAMRFTDAVDFVVDHCALNNIACILIDGASFGTFANWRNVANLNSFYTGNYIVNTSTGQVTCTTPQHGTTPPSTGAHHVNDVQYHTTPTTDGYLGWVCTTAGTPGTWTPFGPLTNQGTWTPTVVGATVVGTPTYAGTYTQIGRMVFFTIQASATTSIATTKGTTTFTLPPGLTPSQDAICASSQNYGAMSGATGLITASGALAYPSTIGAVTSLVIAGQYSI